MPLGLEAVVHVLVQDVVERPQDVARTRVRVRGHERRHAGLHHHHHEPRGQAVAGGVADRDPAAILDGQHVVVVAADLGGREHLRGHLEPRDLEVARKDRGLDARRDLELACEPLLVGESDARLVDLLRHSIHRVAQRLDLGRATDGVRSEITMRDRRGPRDERIDRARQPPRQAECEEQRRERGTADDEEQDADDLARRRERLVDRAQQEVLELVVAGVAGHGDELCEERLSAQRHLVRAAADRCERGRDLVDRDAGGLERQRLAIERDHERAPRVTRRRIGEGVVDRMSDHESADDARAELEAAARDLVRAAIGDPDAGGLAVLERRLDHGAIGEIEAGRGRVRHVRDQPAIGIDEHEHARVERGRERADRIEDRLLRHVLGRDHCLEAWFLGHDAAFLAVK